MNCNCLQVYERYNWPKSCIKRYRKNIAISSSIAIFSDVSKRYNILLSRYKTLNPGCDTTSAGVLGKWNFRWQSIILVNTVVLVPGIQELLCYGQQHHMPLWLCGRSVVQMFLSHLKVLPFSCHKVCKKCHLWRLWSASPGGCPPQQHLLLAQHWSLEARALGVDPSADRSQTRPKSSSCCGSLTFSNPNLLLCSHMWKLEGGQVWASILVLRGEIRLWRFN